MSHSNFGFGFSFGFSSCHVLRIACSLCCHDTASHLPWYSKRAQNFCEMVQSNIVMSCACTTPRFLRPLFQHITRCACPNAAHCSDIPPPTGAIVGWADESLKLHAVSNTECWFAVAVDAAEGLGLPNGCNHFPLLCDLRLQIFQ